MSKQPLYFPPELQQGIYLAWQYLQGGRPAEAEAIITQLLELYPAHPELLHHLGVLLLQSDRAASALPLLEQARVGAPGNGEIWLALTQCLLRLDRAKEAKKVISQAIQKGLQHPLADELLKQARSSPKNKMERPVSLKEAQRQLDDLFRGGRYAEVESRAQQLLSRHAKSPEGWYMLGLALLAQEHFEKAVTPLVRTIELGSQLAEARFNLGYALERLNRLDEALESYQKAVRIRPELAEAHNNLGNVLQKLERPEDSLLAYRRATELRPNSTEYHMNLGRTFHLLERHEEAIAVYRRIIDRQPDHAESYIAVGLALQRLDRYQEAVDVFKKAIAINHPGIIETRNLLANALILLGHQDEAIIIYRHTLAREPEELFGVHSNLLLTLNYQYLLPVDEQFAEACAYGKKAVRRAVPLVEHGNERNPERRLRIGLVSGDLGQHPVGYFLASVLESLDPRHVECVAYATAVRRDVLNDRLRSVIACWRDADKAQLDDAVLARQIQSDEIDILIDLAGHTAKNRLPVFAWKPAPVQVTWLGYFASTGLETIDYVLADRWVLPEAEEGHFTEKPWRLPDAYYCFTPPDIEVAVAQLPAESNKVVTFGCFNNPRKLNNSVIACWARVLQAVPESRLFLKYKGYEDAGLVGRIGERFEQYGIDRERLRFEGPSPRAEYLAAYNEVDIALDPFPFPGGTTSIEGLWMGVPVLSLKGERFISHQGETILHNAGLPEWIANDVDEYVAKAAAFAADLPALVKLRAGLRVQLLASPLCDAPRFARNLEQAFRGMWRLWCEQQNK